jgi:lysozyme
MADKSPTLEKKGPSSELANEGGTSEANAYFKIIAKSMLSLHLMARDMNVARQNVQKLVKMKGGEVAKGADAHWLNETDAETKLNVDKEKLSPTKVEEKEPTKKKSMLSKLGENLFGGGINKLKKNLLRYAKVIFSPKNLLKILGKIALPLTIITAIWQGITGAWDAYQETGSIWEAFKGGIGQIVDFFTFGLIDKEMVGGFMDKVADFLSPVTDAIKTFFGKFSDWFSEKFNAVKSFFGVNVAPSTKVVEVKQDEQAAKDYEKWKAEQEAAIKKQEEDLAKLKKQEEEAQYTGGDEIVRKRMGLQEKSAEVVQKEIETKKAAVAATGATKETKAAAVSGGKPPATAPTKEAAAGPAPTISGGDKWIMEMIKQHEGVRLKPYKDTKGLWTVGVGHLIGDGKSLPPEWDRQFTMEEVDKLFAQDFAEHKKWAEKSPGWDKANPKGQGALIDLAFNMGGGWFKKFKNASSKLASGDFKGAADELIDSEWYKQVKGRAVTIVNLIRDGSGGSPTQVAQAKPLNVPPPAATGGTTAAAGPTGGAGGGGGSLASLVTTQSGVDLSAFNSEFEKRVSTMAADFKAKMGKPLLITSGYRSNEKQKQLWDEALAKNGGDAAKTRKLVAEPMPPLGQGKGSFHLTGYAIDINSKGDTGINSLAGSRDKPTGWLEKFGLTRPVAGEDWHVQATGLAPTPDNPNNPGKTIAVASKDGKATDVATGKSEQIAGNAPSTGTQVAQSSADVASGQRQQQKPNTPIVMNNNTTNVTSVTRTTTTPQPKEQRPDTAVNLAARVA